MKKAMVLLLGAAAFGLVGCNASAHSAKKTNGAAVQPAAQVAAVAPKPTTKAKKKPKHKVTYLEKLQEQMRKQGVDPNHMTGKDLQKLSTDYNQ